MSNWLAEVERKRKAFINRPQPILEYQGKTKKDGWTYVTTTISASPSELYPWSPSIAKKILDYTGGMLRPFWVTDVYRTPQGSSSPKDEKFGRHVLALKCKPREAQFFSQGQGWQIWLQLVSERDSRAADLPRGYLPFDGRVWRYVLSNWRKATFESVRGQLADQAYENEQNAEKVRIEARRMEADLQKYAAKKLASISDVELKNYMLNKHLDKYEAKPTVLVGKNS